MKNYMSKKWLYSVAAGALLIAGQAAGITVHDVLSNGFWSSELRQTEESLNTATTDNYKEKYKNEKTEEYEGLIKTSYLYKKKATTTDGIKWSQKKYQTDEKETATSNRTAVINQTIKTKLPKFKEQIMSYEIHSVGFVFPPFSNYGDFERQDYSFKRRARNARPVHPFIFNNDTNWFFNTLDQFPHGEIFLEHVATTNITSDSNAHITGHFIAQSTLDKCELGLLPSDRVPSYIRFIDVHDRYNYEIGIQVAKNKVCIEQNITKDAVMTYDLEYRCETKYIATFNKRDKWKKSTEHVESYRNFFADEWYQIYTQKQKEHD